MPIIPNLPGGLIRLLETGEFVLFLGAGVGIEAGYSDWKDTLLEVSKNLRPFNASYADLMGVEAQAGRFLQSAELLYLAPITPTDRSRILQAVFNKDPRITRRLKLLMLTRCQGIVTTNFDRSLEMAGAEAHAPLTHFGESDQDLAAARVATRQFLVRLHGRIEVPESLVFALRHYNALPEREQYVEFFRELFLSRNLVFFGFSFADPVISELVRSMTRAVRSLFRREAYALVSEPAQPQLVEALRESGVVAVPYSPDGSHSAAWDLFADYRTGPPPVAAERFETEQVRSHLAVAYARAKGRQFRADRDRMLAALMMPLLSEFGTNAVVEVQDFFSSVEQRLALPRSFDRSHLMESVKLLERDGLIALQGTTLLVGDITAPKELAKDANRLVDGLIARAKIRFGQSGLESQRELLDQLILTALALDGLHLAHTLIREQPLDADRLDRVITEAIQRVRFPARHAAAASAALSDVITSPDPEEEQILTNIAAVVFGTALLLADPLLADKVADPFQRGAYVDASVLLPWLADGHPLRLAYDSVLRSFDLSGIRVLTGYLNEVINHKRLAVEVVQQNRFDDTARFKRYASLFELHNINVFLGGYAGSLERGGTETFDEYLKRVAPFENELQLKRALEALGVVVEDYRLKDYGIAGELKAALKERGKYREDVVVAHDAAQLEVLRAVKGAQNRSYFITADRALVSAVVATSSRHVIPSILLPQQVAFLAQMADRTTTGLQAFSRTLWTVGASVADKVKRYYTDRVLREYEVGLVAEVDKILEALLRDLQGEGIDLDDDDVRDPRSEAARVKLFERLDRFEPRFFQHMAEAQERVRRRSDE
ncbi:MAG TPA: SIR2 family protein [Blastocatellia bacterium]|jgi:hypothetical protein